MRPMTLAIRATAVSKSYRVNQAITRVKYRTLRESLVEAIAKPLRHLRDGAALGKTEEFWALSDVGFEVEPGEAVGVIGRNGAGKSTLLKILSRITWPTRGRIELCGRVGSLLEVGTGFHPELSGRENTFLSGAVLGMSRHEIQNKFDEIVAFSGVEEFLDTPVKRYSSGMRVRLAFAVAAHLEPEILLVDEVLAVGDISFQRKCLEKMGEVTHCGRTIIFVSHNMAAVEALCKRGIVINNGRIEYDGGTDAAIRHYVRLSQQLSTAPVSERTDRSGNGLARLEDIVVVDEQGTATTSVGMGSAPRVQLRFQSRERLAAASITLICVNWMGQRMFTVRSSEAGYPLTAQRGQTTVMCSLAELPLVPGRYHLHVVLKNSRDVLDRVEQAATFEVIPSDVYGTGRFPSPADGTCFVTSGWECEA